MTGTGKGGEKGGEGKAFHVCLLAQLVVTSCLLGVIWVVQVILYPQFQGVGEAAFPEYHQEYMRRITLVVAPLMLAELLLGLGTLLQGWRTPWRVHVLAGAVLIVVVWTVTATVQVPLHERLSEEFSPELGAALTHSNWSRTAIWSLRTGLLAYLVGKALGVTSQARGGEESAPAAEA